MCGRRKAVNKLFSAENNSLLYRFLASPGKDGETVMRQTRRVHMVLSTLAQGIFAVSLVVTLCFYPGLPAETGVHFIGLAYMPETHGFSEAVHRILHEYQEIDVYAAKSWLFYPYCVTGAMLLAGLLLPKLAAKVKTKNMSESARRKLIEGLRITLDVVGLIFALYFCGVWTVQILRQQPMRVLFTELYAVLTLLAFLELILFLVMLSHEDRRKQTNEHKSID